jgi:hypothetical protein
LCSRREFGETYAVNAEVAEDLKVRLAEICEIRFGCGSEQFNSELSEQPDEELSDREPVGREIP